MSGKVVIITGGSGLLGKTYIQGLRAAGYRLINFDLKPSGLDPDAELILDITNEAAVSEAVLKMKERFGRIDGLINNAAFTDTVPSKTQTLQVGAVGLEEYPLDLWKKHFSVNVESVFLMCKAVGGVMKAQKSGSIVNISSIYAVNGPHQNIYKNKIKTPTYSATKAAVIGFTKWLATYYAKENVRANCVVFGGVFDGQGEDFLEAYNNLVPLGRMANREEYVGVIEYLLSDRSSYTTGSTIPVDGGFTAW